MSYGVIYRHEFTDEYDRRKRADILKKDYTGSITEKTGATFSPLHISIQSQGDEKYTILKPTEIELKLFSDNFEFQDIADAGDKDYQIRVYEAPTEDGDLALKHIGYVIPEIFTEPYVVEPYAASIRAASMGILNAEKYVTDTYGEFYTGTATLMTVITRCLNKLGYEIDIWDSTNTFEDRITYHDDSPFKSIKVDQDAFVVTKNDREQALTCMEVLERVLKPFGVNFFMDYGRWVICPFELRATQRTVRIYDYHGTYKSTGNYNPLAQTFNWLNQDQNLEFMPVIRDIESVYEHGLPNDAIGNHDFNDLFVTQSVTDDEIEVPGDWSVNDLADFTAFGFLKGCRLVAAPNDQNGPQAVCLDSDFIEDGAYIEFQGTKTLDFSTNDKFLFSLSYAGTAYERQSDDNDPTYVQPIKDGSLTIDHKVQIKIGSYYLKDDGSWTTTATDIVITDLGDATSGASTLEDRDLGIAAGFREFQISTEEIPEDGLAYARIYKPISQNEGQFTGDSIAKVAYSLLSMVVYPEGETPEESTTFFSEKDVDSYAEEVQYDVDLGDGPTNLHDSSFLIGASNLVTSSWSRGGFTGGIEDIYINTIFLEYATKSNLIRGTQKVKGLFDRWFIDYQKGYTVLSGTYDERMCTFNGEMVEILNSEADVWGDPLEAPTNFAVTTAIEPPTFSGDTFYVLGIEPGEGNNTDTGRVQKAQFDAIGDLNYVTGLNFSSESLYLATDVQSRNLSVGKDGTLLVSTVDTLNDLLYLHVFDGDCVFINSISMSCPGYDSGTRPQPAYFGEDSNIYVAQPASDQVRIRKYDSGLNHLWDSEWFDVPDPDGNNDAPNACAFVFYDDTVILYVAQTTNSLDTWLISVSPSAGSTINQVNIDEADNLRVGYPVVGRFGDNFLVGLYSSFFAVEQVTIYNSSLSELRTMDLSSIGDLMIASTSSGEDNRHPYIATLDGNFIIGNALTNKVKCFNPMTDALIWETDLGAGGNPFRRMSHVDGEKVFLGAWHTSNDVRGFALLNVSDGSVEFSRGSSGIYDNNEINNDRAEPTMKYEGWELDQFGIPTGTPTITNVTLSADPSTDTVPFTSTISYGADNTGDADVTLLLTLDGVEIDSLTIPAGGSNSTTHDEEFLNPGSYDVAFAGSSVTITANGGTVSGGSEGWIDIESAAVDDTDEEQPDGTVDVIQVPSQQSDCSGGTEFNVEWKSTDYCIILPDGPDTETVAQAVSGSISSSVTGLGSTYPGLSPSGYPRIRVYSETFGTADNGESVIFGVPTELEGNGGVFSRYTVNLTGGVDEYIVNETIDILIGGSVFATTSAITALETADSIAQKIYDACDAVGSGVYSFAKNGTRVLVGSTGGAESLDLDIKNAGFEYSTQDIQ